jgi:alkylhydroperoxidase/carboxymuconolactone decarboxylase family protein YurZ
MSRQAAVYCGVPAAHSAFHAAAEILAEAPPKKARPKARRRR